MLVRSIRASTNDICCAFLPSDDPHEIEFFRELVAFQSQEPIKISVMPLRDYLSTTDAAHGTSVVNLLVAEWNVTAHHLRANASFVRINNAVIPPKTV